MPVVEITGITHDGRGVGRLEGQVIFVPRAIPGEVVEVGETVDKKRYLVGEIKRILTPSPERVTPPCPYFAARECGGCQLQHVDYPGQLAIKRRIVEDAMRMTPFKDLALPNVKPSLETWRYRNKVTLHTADAKIGYYQEESHRLTQIEDCHIAPQQVSNVISWWKVSSIPGRGEVILRTNQRGERMLVIRGQMAAPKDAGAWAEEAVRILGLKSLYVESGEKTRLTLGAAYLEDETNGIKYRLSPASFAQVNRTMAGELYALAARMAVETGCDTVIDAYCGIGVLTLILSRFVRRVIGLEINVQAVRDARENALANGVSNAEFIAGPCEKTLGRALAASGEKAVLILDPPRSGLSQEVVKAVVKSGIDKIIYISCNPATLARDLARFHEKGYNPEDIRIVDMFPQTSHVECVVLMTRV